MNPIKVVYLDPDMPELSLPNDGDVGVDLRSSVTVTIDPGKTELVPTGIKLQLPPGYWLDIRDRSGLSKTLHVLAGVVDPSYRGTLLVRLLNHTDQPYIINKYDRIAQGILHKIWVTQQFSFEKVDALDDSVRGERGFGSSGR